MSEIDNLYEYLSSVRWDSYRWELKKLREEAEWARAQLPVKPGDRIRISKTVDYPESSGYYRFRECLGKGALATVHELYLYNGKWCVGFILDETWSVSTSWNDKSDTRLWYGRADKTPNWAEPPSTYTQEQYPEGKDGIFTMSMDSVEKLQYVEQL